MIPVPGRVTTDATSGAPSGRGHGATNRLRLVRSRRGAVLIETLVSVVILAVGLVLISGAVEAVAARFKDQRSATLQVTGPRRAIAYLQAQPWSTLPPVGSPWGLQWGDDVNMTVSGQTNGNDPRLPVYEIVVRDVGLQQASVPDTLWVIVSPHITQQNAGFNLANGGDNRP